MVAPADHPRSRGVYLRHLSGRLGAVGSSPLARGLLTRRLYEEALDGIIPARAGFTRPHDRRGTGPGDHPRSRGVYVLPFSEGQGEPGSSPLARGLPASTVTPCTLTRIIPARAGFTLARVHKMAGTLDHPRSRGVYPAADPARRECGGSSPLARGLHRVGGARRVRPGIIPARAGFTRP